MAQHLGVDRVDPATIKPYVIDFGTSWLPSLASGETLSAVAWTVPTGLMSESETADSTSATIVLSATAEGAYTVEAKATSMPGGYVDVFSFDVIVEDG